MLGTPPEDDATLVHWTNVFTAFEDPTIREQWTDTQAIVERDRHLHERGNGSRAAPTPRDDLITALMNAEVDGEKLNELELADVLRLADVCRQ